MTYKALFSEKEDGMEVNVEEGGLRMRWSAKEVESGCEVRLEVERKESWWTTMGFVRGGEEEGEREGREMMEGLRKRVEEEEERRRGEAV